MIYINFAVHVCSYTTETENKCVYNIIQMLKKNDFSLADGNSKYHLSDMLSFWKSMWQEICINLRRTKQEK